MTNKKLILLLCFILLTSFETTFGKSKHNSKINANKQNNNIKNNPHIGRAKRALLSDDESPFWPHRGKKLQISNLSSDSRFSDLVLNDKSPKNTNSPPFWGQRGRRDRESVDNEFPTQSSEVRFGQDYKNYPGSHHTAYNVNKDYEKDSLDISDLVNSISEKMEESQDATWKSRRHEDDPFWAARGRRQEDPPFWGQRGRREDQELAFWGSRGRRDQDSEPFWGTRGRRDDEEEPFWGNRGRREDEMDPFWDSRSRRDDEMDPFWGNRGRRKEFEASRESLTGYQSLSENRRHQLKESLKEALSKVENNIQNLMRSRRDGRLSSDSFWLSRGRNSQLKGLFHNERLKSHGIPKGMDLLNFVAKPSESSTVLDDRIFAEQPHYILVERSSRSSAEDDPYYITRGKKKFIGYELIKAARDRRGTLDEIVKSVRNDPYYIARGKKNTENSKSSNSTSMNDTLNKAKDLICATIDLAMYKNGGLKIKREVDDNERDRRTILKKLAAQLQADPYFVSRGKRSDDISSNIINVEEFINEVGQKCN